MQNPNNYRSLCHLYHHIEEIFKNNKDISTFSEFFKINEYNKKQSTSESLWSEETNGHLLDNISLSSFVKDMHKIWELEDPSTELSKLMYTKYKNIFNPEYENTKYQLVFLKWDETNNWIILNYFELPDFENLITNINAINLPKNNVLNIYTNAYEYLDKYQSANIEDLGYGDEQDKTILNNFVYNMNFMTYLVYSITTTLSNSPVTNMYDIQSLNGTAIRRTTSKWNRFTEKYFSNEGQNKTQIIISDEPLQSELKDANIPASSFPINYFI